ncbi:hypothetical protein [Nocardioides sp. REDSEA-S30_B4]|jgi:hypothetical protein|nr:hypothetical protein [Nocardioides sp. REDSEA-S30_B4]
MITVVLVALALVWVLAPLPLAVAVGRAFAAGEAPEPAGVRSAAAGPVDA